MTAKRMCLSDETIDGLLFGWRLEIALAHSPIARDRRKTYDKGLRDDRAMLALLPRETLATAIAARGLWSLPGYVERKTAAEMIDAISRCMRGNARPLWLAALGVTP